MKKIIQQSRERLISAPDTVCLERAILMTEAWQQFETESPPVRRALSFAHVLKNMTLDLMTNPIFAGNTSTQPHACMLMPEYGFKMDAQAEIEHEQLKGLLDGQIPCDLLDYWQNRSFGGYCGIGHLAVDLNLVVHQGLEAVLAKVKSHPAKTSAQHDYQHAMIIAVEAVLVWAQRYAIAAEEAAQNTNDPDLQNTLLEVARACRQVPGKPARNLFEALQAIILIHHAIAIEGHGISVSIGLPDRILAPFIYDDFDSETSVNLLCAFMLKIAENSVSGRASKTQAITVGGADHTGRDCSNALTFCFLKACDRVRLGDPPVFLRWHSNLAPEIKQYAAELLAAGLSMPLIINDHMTAKGLINCGVSAEDAWDYCVIGCNELGIPGRAMRCATAIGGTIQYLQLLNDTLFNLESPDSLSDLKQILERMQTLMHERASLMRRQGNEYLGAMIKQVPTPFTSTLMHGCVAKGKDLLVGMPYQFTNFYERGLTNAANALAAIEQVVYVDKATKLSRLIQNLRENFPDNVLHQRLLNAPKWGNADSRADHWALELVRIREQVLDEIDREFAEPTHTVCHVVRSLHHLDGQYIGASADGRLAGQPVADSIGAQTGTAKQGPTGILHSVARLNASNYYRGGYNLNLTLPLSDTTPEIVIALVDGFFYDGGQEIQINCLDAAILYEAQKYPEHYGDLVVRIAGLSARFVDLSRLEQDEIIERALQ